MAHRTLREGWERPRGAGGGEGDFTGGRFRNCGRDLNGREELTAWRRGGCDQGWIQGVSTLEPELKDWTIQTQSTAAQASGHTGAPASAQSWGLSSPVGLGAERACPVGPGSQRRNQAQPTAPTPAALTGECEQTPEKNCTPGLQQTVRPPEHRQQGPKMPQGGLGTVAHSLHSD